MNAKHILLAVFFSASVCIVGADNEEVGRISGHGHSILREKDFFEFVYRVTIPTLEDRAYLWLPIATSDAFQEVTLTRFEAPLEGRSMEDRDFGNRLVFFELGPETSGREIVARYQVLRREKGAYRTEERDIEKYLNPERLVPWHDKFRRIAEDTIRGIPGQREQGLALYKHVLDIFRYDKSGVGWGRGDALYACDVKSGNCTDFHAYFIALSRSAGIPARFAIGAAIPADQSEGTIQGYHCWAEFYADGEWVPIDISEAWKHPALSSYYFGHHPANRLKFSLGRDLVVDPLPASGPINFLVYPILEERGREQILVPILSFRRI